MSDTVLRQLPGATESRGSLLISKKQEKPKVMVGRGVVRKKTRVDRALGLDIVWLTRRADIGLPLMGSMSWESGRGEISTIGLEVQPGGHLRLHYAATGHDGVTIDYDYWVPLDTTPCFYGGRRWWFVCPNATCRRRCRILYLSSTSGYFLCRICQNLTYRSQQVGLTKSDAFSRILFDTDGLRETILATEDTRKRRRAERQFSRLWAKARPLLKRAGIR
jgi:hypothetical protein